MHGRQCFVGDIAGQDDFVARRRVFQGGEKIFVQPAFAAHDNPIQVGIVEGELFKGLQESKVVLFRLDNAYRQQIAFWQLVLVPGGIDGGLWLRRKSWRGGFVNDHDLGRIDVIMPHDVAFCAFRDGNKRIGAAAKEAGISRQSLQYYVMLGLMEPTVVTETGRRMFDGKAVERIKLIKKLNDSGYPLRAIRELFINEQRTEVEGTNDG